MQAGRLRTIRYTAIYFLAFIVSVAVGTAIPLFVPPSKMLLCREGIDFLPAVVLFGVMLVETFRRRTYGVIPLVTTLFVGLATPLFHMVNPKDCGKYLLVSCISPVVGILFLTTTLIWNSVSQVIYLLVNIALMLFIVADYRRMGIPQKRPLVMLCLVSLLFPLCAAILLFVLKGDNSRCKRYLLPMAVVAALTFVINIVILLFPYGMIVANLVMVKSGLYFLLCATIGILLLCDRQVRTVPLRGWLYVAAFFIPHLAIPATQICLDSDHSQDEAV